MSKYSETAKWHMLFVKVNCERKVAAALDAQGFDTYVPLRRVKRQWSDRIKHLQLPLFKGYVFCRFAIEEKMRVLSTPGLCTRFQCGWRPRPIDEDDILRLQNMLRSDWELSTCDLPVVGDAVEVIGQESVRGVLIERNQVCIIAICLNSLGKAVRLHLPIDTIRMVPDGSPANYIPMDVV